MFVGIPHTADSVTITWRLNATPGGGAEFWQGGLDESWAIDDVTVDVDLGTTTTTTTTTTTNFVTTSSSAPTSSTTTTTLAMGDCADVPADATFASIICRLEALLARVNGEPALGAFQSKLGHTLMKARDRAQEARDLCGARNAKKAKTRLKQVARALVQYTHRLKGRPARRNVDEMLRQSFLDPAAALGEDVGTLRSSPTCPGNA